MQQIANGLKKRDMSEYARPLPKTHYFLAL